MDFLSLNASYITLKEVRPIGRVDRRTGMLFINLPKKEIGKKFKVYLVREPEECVEEHF